MIETSLKAVESFMNHDVPALGNLADQILRIESELRELLFVALMLEKKGG